MLTWFVGKSCFITHNAYSLSISLVGFPLTILGGIMGKNIGGGFEAPCRSKNIAREIPPAPWYHSTLVHMLVGGFLPFRYVSINLAVHPLI